MEILDLPPNKSYGFSKIKTVWHQYKNLNYINEPFNDADSLTHWYNLGFRQSKFTGDMYDMRQPEPIWMPSIKEQFNWNHFSWALYKMSPGCTLPVHSDTYVKFREIYSISNPLNIYRAIVFLENWQSGHYFEIDCKPYLNWQAGDCVWWQYDVPHIAANIGETDRYTLQITGVKLD